MGELQPVTTWRGSIAAVFVGSIEAEDVEKIEVNADEVARIFRFQLSMAIKQPDAHEYLYDGERIWGMTAWTIRNLCKAMNEGCSQYSHE